MSGLEEGGHELHHQEGVALAAEGQALLQVEGALLHSYQGNRQRMREKWEKDEFKR